MQWPLLNMFLLYLGLTITGVVWAFLLDDGTKLRDSSALCLFWSWYNIIVLTIACIVCIEQPRYRSTERLASGDEALVDAGDGATAHRVLDISQGGARLHGTPRVGPGGIVTMNIAGLRLPAKVVRCGAHDFAVKFEDTAGERTELIRLVYSGRYSAAVERIEPARVAAAILGRVMR